MAQPLSTTQSSIRLSDALPIQQSHHISTPLTSYVDKSPSPVPAARSPPPPSYWPTTSTTTSPKDRPTTVASTKDRPPPTPRTPTTPSALDERQGHISPQSTRSQPPPSQSDGSKCPAPTLSPSSPVTPSAPPPKPAESEASADDDHSDTIDMEIFSQIIELDDDDQEFSKGMTTAYFQQAGQTFKEMDEALGKKDLEKLSTLGHFLKGSSAALGVTKVQSSCEKIQHYGHKWDEEARTELSDADALGKIEALLGQVKKEYAVAEKWLKKWFDDHAAETS